MQPIRTYRQALYATNAAKCCDLVHAIELGPTKLFLTKFFGYLAHSKAMHAHTHTHIHTRSRFVLSSRANGYIQLFLIDTDILGNV